VAQKERYPPVLDAEQQAPWDGILIIHDTRTGCLFRGVGAGKAGVRPVNSEDLGGELFGFGA
jgi:hypothetical protein